jgi:hypothetical protein
VDTAATRPTGTLQRSESTYDRSAEDHAIGLAGWASVPSVEALSEINNSKSVKVCAKNEIKRLSEKAFGVVNRHTNGQDGIRGH